MKDKQKRKKLKIALIAPFAIIICIVIGGLIDMLIRSQGKIKQFYNEDGTKVEGSIAQRVSLDVNGAKNQMIIRGKSKDNPVLLFISGGPGVPQYWMNEYYENKIEDYYTVCWWDYIGEGMSYDSDLNPSELTLERLENDAVTVTEYLKQRFGQEKIYLMAHSGGTILGINLAKDHPELFHCYYGMAQIVDHGFDRYTEGYRFMKKVFEESDNKKALKQMNQLVTVDENGNVTPKDKKTIAGKWEGILLKAGCATTREMRSDAISVFFPEMHAKCYKFNEKINFWKGKFLYAKTPFTHEDIQLDDDWEFQIPVYLLSGYYDYTCPVTMVKTFYEKMKAPKKDMFVFKESAHSPLWEENQKTIEIMLDNK